MINSSHSIGDILLSKNLKEVLINAGAKLVGFADMSNVEGCNYSYGISVVVPVPVHIVKEIESGPTKAYYEMYHTLNAQLNSI